MKIYINGQAQNFDLGLSVQDLIQQFDLANKRYALELNQAILPRSQYVDTKLNDGDRIEIIHAVGGG
jgi:sulfur carrier protein